MNGSVNFEKSEKIVLMDLLSHPAGYGVQMGGYLEIRPLESGDFAVCEYFNGEANKGMGDYNESLFESVEDAVDEFLRIRHQRKIDLDYEKTESC